MSEETNSTRRVAPFVVLVAVIVTVVFVVPATRSQTPSRPIDTPSSSGSGGPAIKVTTPLSTTPPPSPLVITFPLSVVTPPKSQFISPFFSLDVTRDIPPGALRDVPPGALTVPAEQMEAVTGISELKGFPSPEHLKGSTSFILVQTSKPDDVVQRESPYLVDLIRGNILASVRKPSEMGIIHTDAANIAFRANSDAFIDYNDGILRIRNVDGISQALKVELRSGPLAGRTFSVSPGYELVTSDHKLSRAELRPQDGILRRRTQVLADGWVGVAQYDVESALQQSALVTKLEQQQNTDNKSRRILSDMSRMAAVLNQLYGTAGFSH